MTLEFAQKHTLQASSFFRRVDRAAVVIQYPEAGRAVRSAQEPAKKMGKRTPKHPLPQGAALRRRGRWPAPRASSSVARPPGLR
jgi:hypothetical protein